MMFLGLRVFCLNMMKKVYQLERYLKITGTTLNFYVDQFIEKCS
jgi:hypothetical protein